MTPPGPTDPEARPIEPTKPIDFTDFLPDPADEPTG